MHCSPSAATIMFFLAGGCAFPLDILGEEQIAKQQALSVDRIADKHPVFDDSLTVQETFGTCELTLNKSGSVTNLDVVPFSADDGSLGTTLFSDYVAAASALGTRADSPVHGARQCRAQTVRRRPLRGRGAGGQGWEPGLADLQALSSERPGRAALAAPRLGSLGQRHSNHRRVDCGVIASYDVLPAVSPYVAGMFANHWIKSPKPDVTFAPGEHLAPPTDTGDGLLELTAGVLWRTGTIFAISAKYGLWLPMQNDPGSFSSFVASHIVSLGFRFCVHSKCD